MLTSEATEFAREIWKAMRWNRPSPTTLAWQRCHLMALSLLHDSAPQIQSAQSPKSRRWALKSGRATPSQPNPGFIDFEPQLQADITISTAPKKSETGMPRRQHGRQSQNNLLSLWCWEVDPEHLLPGDQLGTGRASGVRLALSNLWHPATRPRQTQNSTSIFLSGY